MRFELAFPSDDAALRRLLRDSPMDGDIKITLEREPCMDFANGIEGDRTEVLIARPHANEAPVAMGKCSLLTSFVNGAPTCVGYLGQLRIQQDYRARAGILRRGYAALRNSAVGMEEARHFITTIVADNATARRVLEAGMSGLPKYRYLGDMLSLTFPTTGRKGVASGNDALTANAGDWPEIAECLGRYGRRFQFAPCWTQKDLVSTRRSRDLRLEDFLVVRRGSRIVGCLACWDQRKFKQIVVRGYSGRLRLLRPVLNAMAPLTGTAALPAPGSSLPVAFLSHLAVDDDDPEVFEALLRAGLVRAASCGATQAILGLAEQNPLLATAVRRRPRNYRSRAYLVYWPEGEAAARQLAAGPLHLEVAIL